MTDVRDELANNLAKLSKTEEKLAPEIDGNRRPQRSAKDSRPSQSTRVKGRDNLKLSLRTEQLSGRR